MSAIQTHHESKQKLLDAAFAVIRTKGYTATRVEDICEAAGVTKGSFFYHFKSKEELALEAAAHWIAVTSEFFRNAPYHRPADPLDRLLGYVDFRKTLLQGELREFTCLVGTMVQEVYDTWPAIRDACASSIGGHAATLEPDIAAAMEKYGVRGTWTARSLALHTQAVIQGSFILAKAHGGAAVAVESLDHLRRYLRLLFTTTGLREQDAAYKASDGDTDKQDREQLEMRNTNPQEEMTMAATADVKLTEKADAKDWPEMHYVFVERFGHIPQTAGPAWTELHRLVPEIEERNRITGYMSLYRMDQNVYRAGVRLAEKPKHLPRGMHYENYPGGKFHRFVLTGPFSQLGPATGLAARRVREQNLALRDDFNIENYVTDPRATPEDELITEILFPAA
jgi:TetR/AcrR family transcriptional regulator, transcriptional repressor for nem operon